MLGDVQHETRLAHRGARRDDDQVATLEAARHLVEIGKPGRHARHEALVLEQLLDFREALVHQVAHRDETGLEPVVGDGEDRAFRLVQDQVRFLVCLVRVGQNLVRRVNQVPQRRLFLDDLRVVLDVGRAWHAADLACRYSLTGYDAMYAGPPTSSISPPRESSSFSVMKSIASPRSLSVTMRSKMRRCASR